MRWQRSRNPHRPGVAIAAALVMAGPVAALAAPSELILAQGETPQRVGERPEPEEPARPDVQAIADVGGVLTPKGHVVVEPSVTYTNSQVNRFTFLGVEILESFLIGIIEAEDIDRDVLSPALDFRVGVTNRLEVGVKIPYIDREERRSATIPEVGGEQDIAIEQTLDGEGIGDVEASLHYQFNRGDRNGPWFVGNLRYKSTTGRGPFEVDFDDNGVEQEAATGSGFHAAEVSLTTLYRSDPAVLYGNLGYLRNFSDDVDRTLGTGDNAVRVGRVDPGDSVRTSFGIAVSLNPRTSLNLGYKHDFIRETETELNGERLRSSDLNVGALIFGVTQVTSNRSAASLSVEVGATADAPDVTVALRMPFTFGG